MLTFLTIALVGLAGAGIFALRPVVASLKTRWHSNAEVDQQLKFQLLQLGLTAVFLALVYFLSPAGFGAYFRLGNVQTLIQPIAWLGITGRETWLEIAASLGLFITLGTALFMFFQLKKAGVNYRYLAISLLWAIPFSMVNAFSEEAIFRFGVVAPLAGIWSPAVIALLSAVLFGLPHYFGMPSGVIGAWMAGFLGWLLALAVLQTHGLLLAWTIHAVQDIVIFTSLGLMARRA